VHLLHRLYGVDAPAHHSVFLLAGCPSCRPTNTAKALTANRGLDQLLK